jgi:excisionase family DNA binding protein
MACDAQQEATGNDQTVTVAEPARVLGVPPSDLMTAKEAANVLGKSEGTVYALYHAGRLKGCRMGPKGGRILFPTNSVIAYKRGEAPLPEKDKGVKLSHSETKIANSRPQTPRQVPQGLKHFHL